jgi:hypothetical protein
VVVLGRGQFGEWESRCSPCSSVHRVTARPCGCDGSDGLRVGVAGTRRSGGEGRRDEVREQRPDQTRPNEPEWEDSMRSGNFMRRPSCVVWVALGCSTPSSSGGTAHQQHTSSMPAAPTSPVYVYASAGPKLARSLEPGSLPRVVACSRGWAASGGVHGPSPWHQPGFLIPLCPVTGASIHTTESRTSRCTFIIMYP